MNKYESFLERNSIRLYRKMDEFYEIEEQLEYAIKSSICVDLAIFMIEQLNQLNRQEITNGVIDKLVVALRGVFPIKVFYKVQDFAYSQEEATAILTELYREGDSAESLANTNFGMMALANLYLARRTPRERFCLKFRNLSKTATKVISKTRGSCIRALVGNLWHEKDLLFRLSLVSFCLAWV